MPHHVVTGMIEQSLCLVFLVPLRLQAYIRKMSELVLEVVSTGGNLEALGIVSAAGMNGREDTTFLDLTGSREFLTHETAEELLAPMLSPGSKIQKIKFSTKSFGVDAAEVAARAIRNVSGSLIDADMSDVIAGRPEDEALASLRIMCEALSTCKLRHLNLSDNALGEKGIRACSAAFENQDLLESIAFQNVGCSVHGCAALDELLQRTESLRSFHLLNNMSGDEGAKSIAKVLFRCPVMEDFKMASSRVGPEGGLALANALANAGNRLVSLDLHDNPLTSEVASGLATVISRHVGLKKLNLNDTCLGDDGIGPVAGALSMAAVELEDLQLELNEITLDAAETLGNAIRGKHSLRRLNLRENELEDDGAVAVAKAVAGLKGLEVIDACANQIKRGGACALAKITVSLPSLRQLELDENEISEAGIDALREILIKTGKIGVLGSLEENMPDEDDEERESEKDVEDTEVDALIRELQREHL